MHLLNNSNLLIENAIKLDSNIYEMNLKNALVFALARIAPNLLVFTPFQFYLIFLLKVIEHLLLIIMTRK